ncbi:MAG: hypothetical protein ACYDA1_08355 [Vulcanimicrobiaceae bacterium]
MALVLSATQANAAVSSSHDAKGVACTGTGGTLSAQFPIGYVMQIPSSLVFTVSAKNGTDIFTEIVPIEPSPNVLAVFADTIGSYNLSPKTTVVNCYFSSVIGSRRQPISANADTDLKLCADPVHVDIGPSLTIRAVELTRSHISVVVTADIVSLGSINVEQFADDTIVLRSASRKEPISVRKITGFAPETVILQGKRMESDLLFKLGYQSEGSTDLVNLCL